MVDTSALMAIVLNKPKANACTAILATVDRVLISAGTLAEVSIIAARRHAREELARLIGGLGPEIVSVTDASARRVAIAYGKWGKGVHPASLNLGDCFAYELANTEGCALLFVGDDFFRTDINAALV